MSKEQITPAQEPVADLPKGFPPELIPLYDWWKKEGRSWLTALAVAAVAVGAFYGVKGWMHSRALSASKALSQAQSVDELEAAVASHGSAKNGAVMKVHLAKSYFDAGRYQDALDIYEKLESSAPEGFADHVKVGKAFALEGLKKYAEAGEAFNAFVADEANASSFLRFTAQLGAARCKAQGGDKDGAVKDLEALKAKFEKDGPEADRIDSVIDAVKRWTPHAERSFFDAAAAAAKALAEEKPAEAKPAEEKPAEEKPAEAAK